MFLQSAENFAVAEGAVNIWQVPVDGFPGPAE